MTSKKNEDDFTKKMKMTSPIEMTSQKINKYKLRAKKLTMAVGNIYPLLRYFLKIRLIHF